MELSDQDKQILDLAHQLMWRKGVNNPLESQIANGLTQLAQRALSGKEQEPKKEESRGGK